MFYSHSHLRVWSWWQIWIIWSQEARLTAKHYLHSNETVWSLFEIHLMQLIPGNGVKLARTWNVSQTAEMLDMMTDPKFTGEKCCVYLLMYALEVCLMSKCCQRECKLMSLWCLLYDELGKSCGWHINILSSSFISTIDWAVCEGQNTMWNKSCTLFTSTINAAGIYVVSFYEYTWARHKKLSSQHWLSEVVVDNMEETTSRNCICISIFTKQCYYSPLAKN